MHLKAHRFRHFPFAFPCITGQSTTSALFHSPHVHCCFYCDPIVLCLLCNFLLLLYLNWNPYDVINVKHFLTFARYMYRAEKKQSKLHWHLGKKESNWDFDPLLGESQFSFKKKVFNDLMLHVLGIFVHNAGKEFKRIEMLRFYCSESIYMYGWPDTLALQG